MANTAPTGGPTKEEEGHTRRDFLVLTAGAGAAIGAVGLVWPLIDSMNPAADTLALASTEVDLTPVEPGQILTVVWRGKPVFIRHRTDDEVAEADAVDVNKLPDPQPDSDRVQRKEWLVVVGICTHLGCVPLGNQGDFDGWFCPCHGSHYDTSGRIRKGPAPANLVVPEYAFLDDNTIRIG